MRSASIEDRPLDWPRDHCDWCEKQVRAEELKRWNGLCEPCHDSWERALDLIGEDDELERHCSVCGRV
jgi:hypothetical protein